jgi:hypothetical protein
LISWQQERYVELSHGRQITHLGNGVRSFLGAMGPVAQQRQPGLRVAGL